MIPVEPKWLVVSTAPDKLQEEASDHNAAAGSRYAKKPRPVSSVDQPLG